jgi:hypothetical protein
MINLKIKSKEHFELFVFGSALYSEHPSDIDLAIIYDEGFINPQQAIQYRSEILSNLETVNALKIDTILLSKREEKEAEFLSNAKFLRI